MHESILRSALQLSRQQKEKLAEALRTAGLRGDDGGSSHMARATSNTVMGMG
ncbi:MAG: hypothetical protein IKF78_09325 [Atopobiaceae bacterium]|nr:hypothetical protein [Atopobiaceae bacterium]